MTGDRFEFTSSGEPRYSWNATGAVSYDVVRGILADLPVAREASETCLGTAVGGTYIVDTEEPTAGQGFWYLVREHMDTCTRRSTLGFEEKRSRRFRERITDACGN